MKKTLRSRFFGIITSVMMTVMTIASVLPEPVAFAADAANTISVTVNAKNSGGGNTGVGVGANYYILVGLFGKNVDDNQMDITGTKDGKTKPVAWGLEPIDVAEGTPKTVDISNFYEMGTDGSSKGAAVTYSANNYKYDYRLVRTDSVDKQLSTYADCYGSNSIGIDTFPGFKPSKEGNTLTLNEGTASFDLVINCEKNAGFTADDLYEVLVVITHRSDYKTYYRLELTDENIAKKTFNIQTLTNSPNNENWLDGNGNKLLNERVHGEEKADVYVVKKGYAGLNMNSLAAGNGCTYLADGQFARNYKISTKVERPQNADNTQTYYTATVDLTKEVPTKRYTYDQILGGAVNFGIVADRFEQSNHMQTNFAANAYQTDGFRPDLSDPDCGEIYVGELGTFDASDKTKFNAVKANDTKKISFEKLTISETYAKHPESYKAILYSPYGDNIELGDGTSYVQRKEMSTAAIRTKLSGYFSYIQNSSAMLAANKANLTPTKPNDKWVIDGTAYPEDTTLFVDGDTMLDSNGSIGTLLISLRKGQNVIFNFRTDKTVTIEQYYIRTLENGEWENGPKATGADEYGHTDEDQQYRSPFNRWMDQYVMRNVVFNMANASVVNIRGTAGVFLIPRSDAKTEMNGTTTGWVATPGYFFKNSGEWHFPYSGLSNIDFNRGVITVSKRAITGENELEGATLTITSATEKLASDWEYMADLNGAEPYVVDGKTVGFTWESGKSAKVLTGLLDGTYVLSETG